MSPGSRGPRSPERSPPETEGRHSLAMSRHSLCFGGNKRRTPSLGGGGGSGEEWEQAATHSALLGLNREGEEGEGRESHAWLSVKPELPCHKSERGSSGAQLSLTRLSKGLVILAGRLGRSASHSLGRGTVIWRQQRLGEPPLQRPRATFSPAAQRQSRVGDKGRTPLKRRAGAPRKTPCSFSFTAVSQHSTKLLP